MVWCSHQRNMSQNTTLKQRLLTQFKVLTTIPSQHLIVNESLQHISLVNLSLHDVTRLLKTNEEKGLILQGKTSLGNVRVFSDDIQMIESFGNIVLTMYKGREIRFDQKLFELETMLFDHGFVRISKSIIVNVQHIETVSSSFNAKLRLHLANGSYIDVNRSYLKTFKVYMKERKF